MYVEVAQKMKRKVPDREREDMSQDIICRLAQRQVQTKTLAYIVAKEATVDWWRKERYWQNLESLDCVVFDGEGNQVRVIDTLQANEPSLEELAFAKELLENMPTRLVKVAAKKVAGYPLTKAEYEYLRRYRKDQRQLKLIEV